MNAPWTPHSQAPYCNHGPEASQAPARPEPARQADRGPFRWGSFGAHLGARFSSDGICSEWRSQGWSGQGGGFDAGATAGNRASGSRKAVGVAQKEIRHKILLRLCAFAAFFLIPVVESFGASGLDFSVIEENFSTEAACMWSPEKIVVFNVPKEIEVVSHRTLEGHWRADRDAERRPERPIRGSCAPVLIDWATERFDRWRNLAVDDLYGSYGAAIILHYDFNKDAASNGLFGVDLWGAKDVSPLQIFRVALSANDGEPPYDDEASREEYKCEIGWFCLFTKSRPRQVFMVAGIGSLLLLLGIFLLRYEGIISISGGLIALIGADIAVFGPMLIPR